MFYYGKQTHDDSICDVHYFFVKNFDFGDL